MNNEQRFLGQAMHYEDDKPSYPQAAIDSIYQQLYITYEMVFADIGAGAGKLTRQLLQRGNAVYAIEPNVRMRSILQSELNQFAALTIIDGTAERTMLP